MQDALFVLKCAVITIVLVVLMQIRVGSRSVEGHLMTWVHHSNISRALQDVAEGAVKAGQKGKEAVMTLVGSHESADESPAATEASTGGWFKIKRSAAYERQQRALEKLEKEKAAHVNDDLDEDQSKDPARD